MMETTIRRPRELTEWDTYHRVSRTGTYSFLAALPLLVMYELLIVFANRDALSQVRVGAEVWLKQLLAVIGDTGLAAFGIAVLLVGAAIFWRERKQRIPLRARYFVWMILESAVYAVLVAIIVSGLVGAVLTAIPEAAVAKSVMGAALTTEAGTVSSATSPSLLILQRAMEGNLTLQLALSVGAGVYEELLFRVLLVGGLFLLIRHAVGTRALAYGTAAVIGAFLFSLVHYIGPLGDVVTAGSFLFRFFFGLILNILFLTRGFGIAAWTHALYDVMVVLWLT